MDLDTAHIKVHQMPPVASPAMGHWARAPSTSNNFISSSLWSKPDSQLSKYCVVCEIRWCSYQQLTALSISTALVTKLLVIGQLLHPALKFAVSTPWPTFQLCPSSQQILATPLNAAKTGTVACMSETHMTRFDHPRWPTDNKKLLFNTSDSSGFVRNRKRSSITLLSLSSMNCLAAADALSACFWAASKSACTWARRDTNVTRRRTTLKHTNHLSHKPEPTEVSTCYNGSTTPHSLVSESYAFCCITHTILCATTHEQYTVLIRRNIAAHSTQTILPCSSVLT